MPLTRKCLTSIEAQHVHYMASCMLLKYRDRYFAKKETLYFFHFTITNATML